MVNFCKLAGGCLGKHYTQAPTYAGCQEHFTAQVLRRYVVKSPTPSRLRHNARRASTKKEWLTSPFVHVINGVETGHEYGQINGTGNNSPSLFTF